jgi:thiol-disulfide isomerase/thioredoxin
MKRKAARPTVVTLALSAAAAAGYLGYRAMVLEPVAGDRASTTPVAELVDTLPDFSLANMAGEPQSIHSWPGDPLVINFWATWCAPCLREIPLLKSFQDDNPWLTVVGIAIDRRPLVEAFAEEMVFNYPVLMGEADAMNAAARFGAQFGALPFTVFTDAEGAVLGVHTGELHAEHLDNVRAVLEDRRAERITVNEARARLAGRM